MTMTSDPRDPGWKAALKMVPRLFGPDGVARMASPGTDSLTILRGVFMVYVTALLVMLVVLLLMFPLLAGEDDPAGWSTSQGAIAVGVAFIVALVIIMWAQRRPLAGETSAEVAAAYRALAFFKLAFAEAVALVGFVAVFLTNSLSIYLLGLVLSAPALYLAAPTRGDTERRQEQLHQSGRNVDLLGALLGDPQT